LTEFADVNAIRCEIVVRKRLSRQPMAIIEAAGDGMSAHVGALIVEEVSCVLPGWD
jgi:hypothetical protein